MSDMYITLDQAKAQLSIPLGRADLDERVERLIKATERWAAEFLNAPLADYVDSPVSSPPELSADIVEGMLLHLEAHFDKDPQVMETYIKRAEQMLWPHRTGLGV